MCKTNAIASVDFLLDEAVKPIKIQDNQSVTAIHACIPVTAPWSSYGGVSVSVIFLPKRGSDLQNSLTRVPTTER